MAKFNGSNLMESMLESQKGIMDKMVESTKKMANGNTVVNETINKGTEWYNNWLENQKSTISSTTEKVENLGKKTQEGTNKMNEYFQNWQNNQAAAAKQMWDMNQNFFKASTEQAKGFDMSNPMAQFGNMNNQMSNMMNAMNNQNMMSQFQNWAKGFTQQNPFSMDAAKSTTDNMTNLFNQYFEMLNYNFGQMQKSSQAGTPQDAFRNMMNVNEGFVRFYEMWSPMMSSIQDKTFNMESFKKMVEPAMYKDVMDKMFGFMPEHTAQYFQGFASMMQDNMKQMNGGMNYNQMKEMMNGAMPAFNRNEMMDGMLNGYNTFNNNMNNIFAPMAKMVTPNASTKNMAEWKEIADKMVIYNIKNSEMQSMMYEKGVKIMDKIAQSIANKIENGEEVSSVMALYQEWLNTSDAEFVSLFESDEYSKIMAETASLQMKLRKEIDLKLENQMSKLPIATRSDMEEMHKAIYDLKKQVRQLEKMLEMETANEEVKVETPKPTPVADAPKATTATAKKATSTKK